MSEQGEMDWLPPNATPELPPNAPPGTVRVTTGSMARSVSDQEAQDFGISTDRACLVIEQVFYDAEDDVLQHTVTVNYSGHPHEIRYQPTPEDLARRE
ncbi:UTRA domain-containing protein [Streptomyces sp. NPDC017991]|uniref:UTRA domain-containing protein n=1 Tax=Streptomyces sp. NPDC017991 TaxID=3365026 RepID=UPI0037AFC6CF